MPGSGTLDFTSPPGLLEPLKIAPIDDAQGPLVVSGPRAERNTPSARFAANTEVRNAFTNRVLGGRSGAVAPSYDWMFLPPQTSPSRFHETRRRKHSFCETRNPTSSVREKTDQRSGFPPPYPSLDHTPRSSCTPRAMPTGSTRRKLGRPEVQPQSNGFTCGQHFPNHRYPSSRRFHLRTAQLLRPIDGGHQVPCTRD